MKDTDDLREMVELWGHNRASPYSAMLLDFIEKSSQSQTARRPNVLTRDVWRERAGGLRSRILVSLGLDTLPERTPLRPRVVGHIDRTSYSIEKLIYEARPEFPVAAHLYLPRGLSSPAPAVVYSPGHWMENCKLEPDIQLCCANLARLGFITLVFDPIGQGERLSDWLDHGHLEPLLVGLSQAGLMVWETMRAIDYLIDRPEVDRTRIGITGASGGGINTLYTSAVDDRIAVSVPVCYVSELHRVMTAERDRNWEDGVDLCNQIPRIMAYADMADVCGLFAPRPMCIIAGLRDWMFPIQGVRSTFKDLVPIYEVLGARERLHLAEIDSEHGYDKGMRQVAYGWLAHWLLSEGTSNPISEVDCDLLPLAWDPALTYIAPPALADLPILRGRGGSPTLGPGLCFPEGKAPPVGAAITALARRAAEGLPLGLSMPADLPDWKQQRAVLQSRIRDVLGTFPEAALVPDRIFNQVLHMDLFAERIIFESEPGIEIPALFMAPVDWHNHLPTIVYIDELGKSAGLSNGIVRACLNRGLAVLAIDFRGIGETAASDFEAATNALMTDRPLFGQRVFDVLRAIDCLWRRIYITVQVDKGRIGCVGRGMGGLLALYAAAMDERVAAAVVQDSPISYKSLIVERPKFPPSVYLFDVLKAFDLPQLMALVAPRPLLVADPVNGDRAGMSAADAEGICGWAQRVYSMLSPKSQSLQIHAQPGTALGAENIAIWLQEHL